MLFIIFLFLAPSSLPRWVFLRIEEVVGSVVRSERASEIERQEDRTCVSKAKVSGGRLKEGVTAGGRRRGGLLAAFWFGFVTFLSVSLGWILNDGSAIGITS